MRLGMVLMLFFNMALLGGLVLLAWQFLSTRQSVVSVTEQTPNLPTVFPTATQQIPVTVGAQVLEITQTAAIRDIASPTAIENVQVQIAVTLPPTPTVGSTAPPPSNPFDLGGTLALVLRRNGYGNLYALQPQKTGLVRLTAGAWEDRDPMWSPDGKRLAFASDRAGSFDIYVLDIDSGSTRQLTNLPGYEGHPSWSPDGMWLTFEGYVNDNLDVYLVQLDGSQLLRVTTHPAADYSPVWSPAGREIAFISFRDSKSPDIFLRSLDIPDEASGTLRFTSTPKIAEDQIRWSPDARFLLFNDLLSPLQLVYVQERNNPRQNPNDVAQGSFPAWSPEGSGIITAFDQGAKQYLAASPMGEQSAPPTTLPVDGRVRGMHWMAFSLPDGLSGELLNAQTYQDTPAYQEVLSASPGSGTPPYRLVNLPGVSAPDPRLSDRVDESFFALRQRIAQTANWDFLQALDNALEDVNAPQPPGRSSESWNKTGRAIDISQAFYEDEWLYVVRRDVGNLTFFDVWLRVLDNEANKSGEPLRYQPWDLKSRSGDDPLAYDNGGKYADQPPSGYFINLSELARDYDWEPVPASDNWRTFYPGINYWHFEAQAGLDWYLAMAEVYTDDGIPASDVGGAPAPLAPTVALPTVALPTSVSISPTETPLPTATPAPPNPTEPPTVPPVRLGKPTEQTP
jgi:TolB protein